MIQTTHLLTQIIQKSNIELICDAGGCCNDVAAIIDSYLRDRPECIFSDCDYLETANVYTAPYGYNLNYLPYETKKIQTNTDCAIEYVLCNMCVYLNADDWLEQSLACENDTNNCENCHEC